MNEDRHTYNEMKRRGISTLDLNNVLKLVGINISNKGLQNHLDSEFKTTTDDRLKLVAKRMISSYDNLIETLKFEM